MQSSDLPVDDDTISPAGSDGANGTKALASVGLPRKERKTSLTDRKLDDLAAKHLVSPVDITDSKVAGLVARVFPNGRRSFYFKWRPKPEAGGRRRFRSMRLDASNVNEARQKAMEASAQVSIGRDPTVTSAAFTPMSTTTVAEAVKQFVDHLTGIGRKPAYVKNVEGMFRNHVLLVLGQHRLIDVTQKDLSDLLASLKKKASAKADGPVVERRSSKAPNGRNRQHDGTKRRVSVMPNRVYTQINSLLRWATEEGVLPSGAAPLVRRPIPVEPSKARLDAGTKRVLRAGHLARIWIAVTDEPPHVRNLIRLLLLLPLRREEVTGLRWGEVNGLETGSNVVQFDVTAFTGPRLDIPAERMNGGKRPQMMPLPPSAVAMLEEMRKFKGVGGDFVFSVTAGRTSFAGWQSLMVRLRERCNGLPEHWNIHDFRTAFATEVGDRLNAEPSIVSRLLSHALENQLGVTWRYDQSRRIEPMLALLTRWQDLILEEVETELRRRRQESGGSVEANILGLRLSE
ncbi:tyrosine-type recombinase/integrase [Azospirillum sp. B510]|uniref:tyrosine-type recombinase/integrase n=1 Tax=Azospirillum sp. (strain B510) TaxID=137722 RepID=UPI000315A7D4|nr:integrase family protein [Azospirillum sp. B510]